VLTPRHFNELTGYAFVAPIAGTTRGWPFEVAIPAGGRVQGVVMADQTKSIDHKVRYVSFLAQAPRGLVDDILDRVGLILAR
jgi:mRNA interferase MazF